ncbi:MAG: protein kinase, partial [Planctomycetota bacterium]|nr:protein kinase [Planctomycetota bacterium]
MIGEQLGGYTIRSELGSGGMGKVYLAENGRRCALKLLHPHLLDSTEAVDRFKLEAELGRRVEHENVVRTFDVGSADVDGVTHHYLVMDYVEGQTLRALLHDVGRVPEELCRHIGREVAHGLAAIHETGVVHRDIKPENVLITKDHVVKVMDLGVAKLLDEAIKLSQTGAFQGSLLYAAPEQFSGATPDPRADFYSLGLVLYELATGRHPFAADSTAEVLARLLSEDPRPAAELNPQLSPFFEEVCKALLQKDRERRIAFLPDGEESAWWRERALAIRLETRRPLRRIRIPRETELYGREHDLAQLHGLWEHVKAGNGRVLLVEGEAGIGKTRFIDELVARLRQDGEDLNFLFGSYPPGGAATAAGAFSTAYGEHFGYEGLEETLARCLTTTPVLVPAFAALLAGDVVRAGAQPLNKDAFQTCFVNATRALADERPTIVLIDDLHFAPEEGRALFTALALAIPGQRVLLVGNRRPGVDEDWVAGLTRLEQTTSLALARLGPKDLVRLLEDTLRSKRLAADLASQIAVKSDGNPFFVFEILRGLREEKFLTQKPDGTWVTTQIIENIQIPSSVLDLVNAHVAALDDDERNLLEVAACCGYEFDPTLVGNVLGIPTIPTLQSFGRIEKTHRLVRSAGRRLVFDHHQVQEALYAGILEQLREEYHGALAGALEARARDAGAEIDGATAVNLCEHYLASNRPQGAADYLGQALQHLEAGHLYGSVVELAKRTL